MTAGSAWRSWRARPGLTPTAVLLVLLLLATWIWPAFSGGFEPQIEPDSESYTAAPLDRSPSVALSYYRTLGYPWLLKLAGHLAPGFAAIPYLQALLYSLGVMVFYWGVVHATRNKWIALAAASPLPFALTTLFTTSLLTESVAASLALMAAGLVFTLRSVQWRKWMWPLLALVVFSAYQIRPTAQWLVVWLPLAACFLSWRLGIRNAWQTTLAVSVATLVPWLLFSGLRLAVVGHFGLVSFAGTNLAAISTFLVDDESISALPADTRPIARSILKRRVGNNWPQLTTTDDAREWFPRYNKSLWKIAYRSANWHMHRQQRRAGVARAEDLWGKNFSVERDRRLQAFAVGVIRQRAGGYLSWIWGATRYGISGMLGRLDVGLGLAVLLVVSIWRLWPVRSGSQPTPLHRASLALGAVCCLHCLGALILVSMVSFPMPRYLSQVILLLPSGLLLLALSLWPRVLPSR